MTRTALLLAAIAASACTASGATQPSGNNRELGTIRWTIERATKATDGRVQLSMSHGEGGRSRNNWSSGYALSDLVGLDSARLNGAGMAPVQFALNREAGRFACSGNAGGGEGMGSCSFAADQNFAARLAAAGIAAPTERQSYQLALGNVRSDLITALTQNGYQRPDIDDLVAMGVHRVTPEYVRAMAEAGYRLGDPGGLVKFRIFNIDPAYIRELAAIGPQFRSLSADDLVAFRIHRVSPDLVRAYSSLGYQGLDRDDLVAMSIHGVSPAFITELGALGYRGIAADKLVAMRIHGVTPDYIRGLRTQGIALPSPDQLVRLRISGYRPR